MLSIAKLSLGLYKNRLCWLFRVLLIDASTRRKRTVHDKMKKKNINKKDESCTFHALRKTFYHKKGTLEIKEFKLLDLS